MQTIPVFFTFDRNFLLPALVAMHSMLKHANPSYQYHLYVFHTKLTPKDQKKLSRSIEEFKNQSLYFIDVSEYNDKIKSFGSKAHYSKEIFYKLIAADVLPDYDRIICSDVDVVFTGDISPVYFMFPNEKFYYAGVGPIENSRMPYYQPDFNEDELSVLEHEIAAGFMLVNLQQIREDNKQEEIINYYIENYPRLRLPEQDCIILTCWPYIKYLPFEYNLSIGFYHFDIGDREFYQGNTEFAGDRNAAIAKLQKALDYPVQIHYAGFNKPWNSFFITKQGEWVKALFETKGAVLMYIQLLPFYLFRRTKRYSLKRFLRKVQKKLFKQ